MGKIYTRKILFVIAAMLLCILVAILIRLFFSSRTVRMTTDPIEVEPEKRSIMQTAPATHAPGFGNSATGTYHTNGAENTCSRNRDATKCAFKWTEDWKGNRSSQYTGAGMITEATSLSG